MTGNLLETLRHRIDPRDALAARCDARGVPSIGRARELDLLRSAGFRDLSAARMLEGHWNAVQLIALFGTPAQRRESERDLALGHLFGVWNTEAHDGLHAIDNGDGSLQLHGRKTWTSGAGTVTRPLVTARLPSGEMQLCLLAVETLRLDIDRSAWRPLGMHDSDTFTVGVSGARVERRHVIGAPGDYGRAPWLLGGATRFAAVHAGGVDRLVAETARFLGERGRDDDQMQLARLGEMRLAAETARHWVNGAAAAWSAFDGEPSAAASDALCTYADMTRLAVERAAFDVTERAMRAVGANGLVEPEPFAGLVRDLLMYLRQPAPDAALLRVGRASRTNASRSVDIAAEIGTSG